MIRSEKRACLIARGWACRKQAESDVWYLAGRICTSVLARDTLKNRRSRERSYNDREFALRFWIPRSRCLMRFTGGVNGWKRETVCAELEVRAKKSSPSNKRASQVFSIFSEFFGKANIGIVESATSCKRTFNELEKKFFQLQFSFRATGLTSIFFFFFPRVQMDRVVYVR